MNKNDILNDMVADGNGYLTTSQVLDSGISKPTLAAYVSEHGMERVAHGVYLAKESWEDELYQICLLNRKAVFSHETALYLHGLMEREPRTITVTVCAGYNATHLRKRGIRVFQVKKDIYELGRSEIMTGFGNTVNVYDVDRTVCDILRRKNSMDIQVFQYALREYMTGSNKNLNRLMEYAKCLRVEELARIYTEVMI